MLELKMLFTIQNNAGATMSQLYFALTIVASHADVLRGSSRVPAPRNQVSCEGTRDEPLRTSAWEAITIVVATRLVTST